MPGIFVDDTFTAIDGTLITSRSGETGATWTTHPSPSGQQTISANRARASTAGALYASGVPDTAEYDVEANYHFLTDLNGQSIIGRLSTAAFTGYLFRYSGGAWSFYSVLNGTFTTLSVINAALIAGQTYAIKLEIRDASKKTYVDGVQVNSSTSNTITDAGRVGLREHTGATSATTGKHIDRIWATNLVTAASHPLTATVAATSASAATALQLSHPVTGTTAGTSATSALQIVLTHPLTASATATSSATSTALLLSHALTGAATGTSATTATLGSAAASHALTGTTAGTSATGASQITLTHPLTASSAGTSSTSATQLVTSHPLTANATGSATSAATALQVSHALTAASTATASATATGIALAHPLTATVAGTSGAAVSAIQASHPLAASVAGTASASASAIQISHPLTGASAGTAVATASLAAPAAITRVQDSFTDGAGTLLSAHTGEVGATWTLRSGDTGSMVITDANRVRNTSTALASYFASGALTTVDQDISVVYHFKSDVSQGVALLGRWNETTSYYRVNYVNNVTTPNFQLQKAVSGTITTLGTFNFTPAAGSDTIVLLQLRDATKKVFVNGAEAISSIDNAVTSGTRAGAQMQVGTSTNIAGIHLDDFKAEDYAVSIAHQLAGSVAATSTSTATQISLSHPLTAITSGTSTSAATALQLSHPLTASATATSSAAATAITVSHPLTGSSAGTAIATASLAGAATAHPLTGSSAGTSSASARLVLAGYGAGLYGAGTYGTSTAASHALTGASAGTATASAIQIITSHPLTGVVMAQSSLNALRLILSHPLTATATGTSASNATAIVTGQGLARFQSFIVG
ncbi:MAG TPA: hypothetical protein VNJ04_19730 [Gemmatimonadaceae bacterium]|nr:hypothetical protein [Gemmatimonadaceae bacterium]